MRTRLIASVGALLGIFLLLNATSQSAPPLVSIVSNKEAVEDRNRASIAANYFHSYIPPTTKLPENKSVYGKDNREDVLTLKDKTDPVSQAMWQSAQSTCLLTSRSRLQITTEGYTLQMERYQNGIYPACENEKFAKQKVGGWCSGFMVGDDVVATAGHCCEPDDNEAAQIAFIFGFFAKGDDTPSTLKKEQVYFGTKVLGHALSDSGDFAVIQLDRKVTFPQAAPLKVRKQDAPQVGQSVGMIGHPSGLPSKSAFDPEANKSAIFEVTDVWLRTNLDAYAGNSGSAVFAADGRTVEGILVRGRGDFRIFEDTCCYSAVYGPDVDPGEVVTRASVFVPHVPSH